MLSAQVDTKVINLYLVLRTLSTKRLISCTLVVNNFLVLYLVLNSC